MSTINHDTGAHRFTTEVDGSHAELDYTLADGVMTITHTRVPPEIGGRGIAAQLMEAALSAARVAGWSVNPACSYAKAYLEKLPPATRRRWAGAASRGAWGALRAPPALTKLHRVRRPAVPVSADPLRTRA